MKKIILISNDKLYFDKNKVLGDYNDIINIIESLSKKIIYLISRVSIVKGIFQANIKNKSKLKISQIKNFNIIDKKSIYGLNNTI